MSFQFNNKKGIDSVIRTKILSYKEILFKQTS